MKYAPFFNTILGCANSEEVFSYLLDNLNNSITSWDYFVNWDKVLGNLKDAEMDLHLFNYLVGKQDVETEFSHLLKRYPCLVRLIPMLLACRDANFKILTDFSSGELQYENFSFEPTTNLTAAQVEKVCRFAREMGLLQLFEDNRIKSVPSYVLGIEVGLDTNGRKNRGGSAMEDIARGLLTTICQKHNFAFLSEATARSIKATWGIELQADKSRRRFDFAVKCSNTLYLIETNYYGGGGSKLKATAGEYQALHDFVLAEGHRFIWITDGRGWLKTRNPLQEAFNHLDYILNLKMITAGILEHILVNRL